MTTLAELVPALAPAVGGPVRPVEAYYFEDLLRGLGLTQAGLSDHLEVTRKTVNNWARGRAPIPKAVLLYLEMKREVRKMGTLE